MHTPQGMGTPALPSIRPERVVAIVAIVLDIAVKPRDLAAGVLRDFRAVLVRLVAAAPLEFVVDAGDYIVGLVPAEAVGG